MKKQNIREREREREREQTWSWETGQREREARSREEEAKRDSCKTLRKVTKTEPASANGTRLPSPLMGLFPSHTVQPMTADLSIARSKTGMALLPQSLQTSPFLSLSLSLSHFQFHPFPLRIIQVLFFYGFTHTHLISLHGLGLAFNISIHSHPQLSRLCNSDMNWAETLVWLFFFFVFGILNYSLLLKMYSDFKCSPVTCYVSFQLCINCILVQIHVSIAQFFFFFFLSLTLKHQWTFIFYLQKKKKINEPKISDRSRKIILKIKTKN